MRGPKRSFVPAIVATLLLGLPACAGGPDGSASAGSSSPSTASDPGNEATASADPQFEGHPAAGLAFLQWPDPNSPASHIFVVDDDGTLRRVTGVSQDSKGASFPTWSPDRTQLAFGSPKVGGDFEVSVVSQDGSGERVIAEGVRPRWSPDGNRILFGTVDEWTGQPSSMVVIDLETGATIDLGPGTDPEWMPDGERISYLRPFVDPGDGQPVTEEYVIDTIPADGGPAEELVAAEAIAWSPDGSRCLLVNAGVVSLGDADGSDARELVNGWKPIWSPQGDAFVFAYDVNMSGIGVLALADLNGHARWSGVAGDRPTWSPDGTRIAVEVGASTSEVLVLDASTGEVLWRTEGVQPAW